MTNFYRQVMKSSKGRQLVESILQELGLVALKTGLAKFESDKLTTAFCELIALNSNDDDEAKGEPEKFVFDGCGIQLDQYWKSKSKPTRKIRIGSIDMEEESIRPSSVSYRGNRFPTKCRWMTFKHLTSHYTLIT